MINSIIKQLKENFENGKPLSDGLTINKELWSIIVDYVDVDPDDKDEFTELLLKTAYEALELDDL